jgi:hypothetical protein
MLPNPVGVSWEIRTKRTMLDPFGILWLPLVMRGVCVLGGVSETSFRKDALLSGIDRYRASIVVVSNISVGS